MMPETRGKLNQYLLATSETEEKDYGEFQQGEEGKALNRLKSSQGKAYGAYKFKV